MATFKHDAQGFLVGEIIENGRDMLAAHQQSVNLWRAIRTDVRAISRAVGVQVATASRTSRPGVQAAIARAPANSQARSSRTVGGNALQMQPVAQPAGRRSGVTSSAQRASSRTTARPSTSVAVAMPARGTDGRFVAGAKMATGAGSEATQSILPPSVAPPIAMPARGDGGRFLAGAKDEREAPGGAAVGGTINRLSDSVGRLSGALLSADNVDPTINAAKEIADVVSPLGRGLFSMMGKSAERKKERWYSRILRALTPKSAAAAPVAAGAGGGGMLGGLGGMLASVPSMLMSVFTRILMPIAALWGAWELGKWIGEKIYGWLDSSGLLAKAFDAFDAIGESFTGAWESVKSGFTTVTTGIEGAWKSITDGFTSALDGLMLLPNKLGTFFSGLDDAMRNVPVIGRAYAAAADGLKSAGATAKAGFDEGKSGKVDGAPTSAMQAIGRDVGKGVAAATEIGSQAKAGYTAARGGTPEVPAPTGIVQRAVRSVGGAVGGVAQAGSNAMTMLQAGRDAGMGTKELANFMGQNAHESGGFRTLKENLNYDAAGLRKTFGKYYKTDAEAQADAKNPEAIANKVYGGRMGNTEAGDGYKFRGRGFTQLTGKDNYGAAGKALGIDLLGNPDAAADPATAAKISAWYWKSRVSSKGAGEDVTKATKLVNGGYIGLEDRQKKAAEWEARIAAGGAVAINANGLSSAPRGSTVSVAAVNLPPVVAANVPPSTPDKIAAMPEMKEPPTQLNSGAGGGRGTVQVTMPREIGQNVGDRGIAHVVSGGLGAN